MLLHGRLEMVHVDFMLCGEDAVKLEQNCMLTQRVSICLRPSQIQSGAAADCLVAGYETLSCHCSSQSWMTRFCVQQRLTWSMGMSEGALHGGSWFGRTCQTLSRKIAANLFLLRKRSIGTCST